jgi:hypothetical protein
MLKVNDRVKIAETSKYYRKSDKSNPIDAVGTITKIKGDYLGISVLWENGIYNGYSSCDLELVNTIEQENYKYSKEDALKLIEFIIKNFSNGKLAGLNSQEIFEKFKNK